MSPLEAINTILSNANALEVRGSENARRMLTICDVGEGLRKFLASVEASAQEVKKETSEDSHEKEQEQDLPQ